VTVGYQPKGTGANTIPVGTARKQVGYDPDFTKKKLGGKAAGAGEKDDGDAGNTEGIEGLNSGVGIRAQVDGSSVKPGTEEMVNEGNGKVETWNGHGHGPVGSDRDATGVPAGSKSLAGETAIPIGAPDKWTKEDFRAMMGLNLDSSKETIPNHTFPRVSTNEQPGPQMCNPTTTLEPPPVPSPPKTMTEVRLDIQNDSAHSGTPESPPRDTRLGFGIDTIADFLRESLGVPTLSSSSHLDPTHSSIAEKAAFTASSENQAKTTADENVTEGFAVATSADVRQVTISAGKKHAKASESEPPMIKLTKAELSRLSAGVRNEDGTVTFFRPSFVEVDPWGPLGS
jgi:hypothetical protein